MRDDTDDRLDALFAAMRNHHEEPLSQEDHFETRFMARLAERKAAGSPWHRMVWRLVPAFSLLTALTLACSLAYSPARSSDLFAAIAVPQEEGMYRMVLAGE